jgi:hypothetical protein
MRTAQSFETRRDKRRERNARWRARKQRLRSVAEPIRAEWRGKHVFTLTLHDELTDETYVQKFFLSQKRINSYRVTTNNEPWREQISATRALADLRKRLPRFVIPE